MKQLSDWWWPTLPLTKVAAIRRSLDLDPGLWTPAGRPFESVYPRSLARCSPLLMMLARPGPGPGPGPFRLGVSVPVP